MAEDFKQPHGEWAEVETLEARLARGERLTLDEETRDLLRRVGEQVALAPELVAERLGSLEGAEALVREARARIRDGSRALSAALRQAWREAEAGKPEEASTVLEEFIRTQPVPWYRELARRELALVPLRAARGA
ncbi:MAG TPA: DUF2379 family protein [Myxococcaceae bacterium]|nr:DUF2379 family protein [Myxococcaceae bacterium]